MSSSKKENYPYLAIIGPTASGKSSLAMKLALELDGEIVSCDSVQIYKGFNIGSAKPTQEEQNQVKHHMIDVLDDDSPYDASQFAEQARAKIQEILSRGKVPVVVGGTGLYYRFLIGEKIHSLPSDEKLRAELKKLSPEELAVKLEALDPERRKMIHDNDHYRLARAVEVATLSQKSFAEQVSEAGDEDFKPLVSVLLNPPRQLLHERIAMRAEQMVKEGLLAEVKELRKRYPEFMKAMQTIGYKEANEFLSGDIETEEDLLFRIICSTRQYAKRQTTFFKKFPCDLTLEGSKDWEQVKDLFLKRKPQA